MLDVNQLNREGRRQAGWTRGLQADQLSIIVPAEAEGMWERTYEHMCRRPLEAEERADDAYTEWAAGLVAVVGEPPGNERGGIVEHVTGATEAKAFSIADAHCHEYGRVARVSGLDFVYNRLMFDCIAP